jgi:cell division protease FtsH
VEAKKELEYFANYLSDPKKYAASGVRSPKGVLLYGPSGTGKTLLAKAMAGACNVPFICAEGNRFLGK